MNSTEKKRAEQFVQEWATTHPVQQPNPIVLAVPKEWEKQVNVINQMVDALEATVEGADFRFDRASYSRYSSDIINSVCKIEGPRETHPILAERKAEVTRRNAERVNATQNLVRRIWNDEVTFQNVLDELDEIEAKESK